MDLINILKNNLSNLDENINNLSTNLKDKNFNKFNIDTITKVPERSLIKGAILGVVIGDALGVPFEFKKAEEIENKNGGGRTMEATRRYMVR